MAEVTDRIVKGSQKIVGETGKLAQGALSGTGKLAKGAIEGTGKLARKALKGTANLAEGALDETASLAKGVFGTTEDLAKGAIGDTAKFAKNTLSRTGRVAKDILHGHVGDALSDTESLVTGTFSDVVSDIESGLDHGLGNKYVSTGLKVLLALYAAFAAPKLPKSVALMLDHTIVRILIAALIVFVATKDSSMAILLALAFILSLQTANKYKLIDTSQSVSKKGHLSWLPSQNRGAPHGEGGVHENYANYNSLEEGHDTHSHTFAPAGFEEETHLLPHQVQDHHSPLAELAPDEDHSPTPTHLSAQGHPDHHQPHPAPTVHHEPDAELAPIGLHTEQESSHVQTHAAPGDNCVPGANQSTCVQSYRNEFCPQGLNQPAGYDHGLEYSKV